jgi:hypothetical protein
VISAAIATGAKLAAEIERAATVSAFLNVNFISLSLIVSPHNAMIEQ